MTIAVSKEPTSLLNSRPSIDRRCQFEHLESIPGCIPGAYLHNYCAWVGNHQQRTGEAVWVPVKEWIRQASGGGGLRVGGPTIVRIAFLFL